MRLSDILSAGPGGRAQVHYPGIPITILLPSAVRDHFAMGTLQQWLVGAFTPGMTWRNGIAISEPLLGVQDWRQVLTLFVHENVHWWQLWRRMGPTDFPATYGWQALLSRVRHGSAHMHDEHLVEREAKRIAANVMAEIDVQLTVRQPVTFDLTAWLEQHLPASRP